MSKPHVLTLDPETYDRLEECSTTFGMGGAKHIDDATGYISFLVDPDVWERLGELHEDRAEAVRILLNRDK